MYPFREVMYLSLMHMDKYREVPHISFLMYTTSLSITDSATFLSPQPDLGCSWITRGETPDLAQTIREQLPFQWITEEASYTVVSQWITEEASYMHCGEPESLERPLDASEAATETRRD